jgi:predicted PP-loop superfamily ATPase
MDAYILSEKGIKVTSGLVYLIKGKLHGEKKRRRKNKKVAVKMVAASGNGDALATIMKIKKLAAEVGGIRALKSLVDVLSE